MIGVAMPDSPAPLPHVVIVGGGFGGLTAAKALKRKPVRVTLVDRQNHHLFQMLLYQVATAGLSPGDIASPIRWILRRQANTRVLMADAQRVDAAGRTLITDVGPIAFDYLILAPGVTHSYFGHEEWRAHAPGLKTLDDALHLRRQLLLAFERAEAEADPERRAAWLSFGIVGGGPTGVELAGTLAEIARHTLKHEFRNIDPSHARIRLIEAGPRILSSFPPDLSRAAERQLERLGVEVSTGAAVTDINETGYRIGDAFVASHTVVWAAGVAASPLARTLGVPLDRAGRVRVRADLSVPDHPEIFVAGDLAAVEHRGRPVPGVAPAAKQMGRHVATAIRARIASRASSPFEYRDYGNLATIGRMAAIVHLGRLKLSGLLAWWFWLAAHVFFLIGFRNRLVVLLDWAWAYWSYQRGARIILGADADRSARQE